METELVLAGTVVVGVAGTPSSDRALDWAADQASREGRALTLAHGIDPAGRDRSGVNRQGISRARAAASLMLERARRRVADRAPYLTVHEAIWTCDARVMLPVLSERAALVVVGWRGLGPVATRLLGSVGAAVSRHAACRVIVVRSGDPSSVRSGVLVGADGTGRSRTTVEFAYRQASMWGLSLTIVHCFRGGRAGYQDEARLEVAASLAGLAEKFPGVRARTELVRGAPDTILLRASSGMDLVVLGAHSIGAPTTPVSGSTAAMVMEHATCPVAIVPTGES